MNSAQRRSAAIAAGLAAIVFGLAFAPVSEPDLYFHLASGKYLADTGHIQTENSWSFTAPGHPFPPTAWAFDSLVWLLYAQGGFAAVQVGSALLIALAFVLVYLGARREGAGLSASATVALAIAAASVGRFTQRPQVVTWCFLAGAVLLLREARRSGRRWPLIAVPLGIALWSNFHSGAVFGVALAGIFAAGALLKRSRPVWPWLACAAASAVALLLNPAGASVLTNAWDHLGRTGVVGDIIEFQPPTLEESAAFFPLLALAGAALIRRGRELNLTEVLVFGAFAAAALHERRNLAECLVVIAAPLAVRLSELLVAASARPLILTAAQIVLPPVAFLAALGVAREPLPVFWQRIHLGANPFRIPLAAAAFIREQGVQGRCFSSMDFGGFVAFALPESKVFHDPRLMAYPDSLWEELKKAEGDEVAFDALVNRFDIEWSLRSNRPLFFSGTGVLSKARWALVYSDDAATVRVRRDIPRFAQLIAEHELHEFLPGPGGIKEQWAATSGPRRERLVAELERAAATQPEMAEPHVGLCLEYASRDRLPEAEQACLRAAGAIEQRRRYEPMSGTLRRRDLAIAWARLGGAQRAAGDLPSARRSFAGSLLALPDNPSSLLGLGLTFLEEDSPTACEYFRRAAKAAPDFAPAQTALTRCP